MVDQKARKVWNVFFWVFWFLVCFDCTAHARHAAAAATAYAPVCERSLIACRCRRSPGLPGEHCDAGEHSPGRRGLTSLGQCATLAASGLASAASKVRGGGRWRSPKWSQGEPLVKLSNKFSSAQDKAARSGFTWLTKNVRRRGSRERSERGPKNY